jgi:hypothetical protein
MQRQFLSVSDPRRPADADHVEAEVGLDLLALAFQSAAISVEASAPSSSPLYQANTRCGGS